MTSIQRPGLAARSRSSSSRGYGCAYGSYTVGLSGKTSGTRKPKVTESPRHTIRNPPAGLAAGGEDHVQLVVARVDEATRHPALGIEGHDRRHAHRAEHPARRQDHGVQRPPEGAVPGERAVLDPVALRVHVGLAHAHARGLA